MKHLNFLSKSGSQSRSHSIVTLCTTVGSPSAHRRSTMLKLISVLVLILTIGVGQVWGETGTLVSALNGISSGDTYYITALNSSKYYTVPNTTISGQTFTCTEGSYNSTTKKITPATGAGEFVFTAVANVSNAYYIYNTNLKKYLAATGSKTFGYVDSNSSDYGYWTFSTVSSGGFSGQFSKTHNSKTHYMRAYNNSVRCYDGTSNNGVYLFKKDAASFTVTAQSNNTTYGTVSLSGTTITGSPKTNCRYATPAYSVSPANSATVSQSGNTFTVTPSANTTVTINFEAIPKHTLNYHDGDGNNTKTNVYEGTNLITALGTPAESCDATSTTFMGWTTTEIATKTNTAPTYVSADAVVNSTTAAATYYAVYAKGTETQTPIANSWTRITSTSQLTDGATVMLVQYYSDYAINTNPGATSCTANAEITNSNTSLRWIAEQSGTKWKFKTSASKYLSTSALDNNTGLSLDATYDEWTITVDNGGGTGSNNTYNNTNCFKLNNGSDLEYYSNTFKLYTWSLKYSSAYPFYIYIQKTNSSVSYSEYLTSCCEPLASINGSVSLTNDGCGAGELKATWKMKATTGIGSQVLHIYKASDNTEVTAKKVTGLSASTENQTQTISGLDNCTAYYVKVENISQGGSFCGDEMAGTSSSATTKGYTYGITKENVSLKAGETEAASTCDGGFMAEYVANTGYALPGTISVSGVSNFEWDGGVLYIEEENVTGNVTTTIAGICVKPSIGTQPASASYQQGATPVALSVAATLSSGTLTYLWKVSTNDGVSWSDASGTNNAAIYAAANISTANTGTTKYKCIVGNQQGGCEVESDVATIEVTAPSKCLTPTFTVATDTYYEDKSVELGCNTAGVTIYYTTNNTTPTTSSSVYSSAITVTQTTTIKAIAVKAGLIDSDVAEATYTIKCETPTIVLAAGNYTGVQTTTITKGYGTKIYYTTDGSTPSNTNGTEYTGAVSIDQPMTLKAIVWKDGCTNSEVASAAYTLNCTTPTFNYGTGTYTGAQSIMLSGTAGADIYYTLDGTDPSKTHGTKYTAAIEVSANQTVKAIAVKEGWGDSEIASATYTIQYNVYWWVNGTDWNDKGGSTLVTYGQTATAPTTAPTKANGCGDKFMGWTTIPDYEDDDTAPTGMFTETSAAITKETNFYAVFADYGENE